MHMGAGRRDESWKATVPMVSVLVRDDGVRNWVALFVVYTQVMSGRFKDFGSGAGKAKVFMFEV
jgi:hypothetical protein